MDEKRKKVDFFFDQSDHSYWLLGRRLPHITQIIEWIDPYLPYGDMLTGLLRKAALGSKVHAATALDDTGQLDESTVDERVRPYLDAWRLFRSQFQIGDMGCVEMPMYHSLYEYAGTVDRAGKCPDGRPFVIEIKTVAQLRPVTALQTAAQLMMVCKSEEVFHGKRLAVQLHRNGEYTMEEYSDRADFRTFLAALQLFNWKEAKTR